MTIGISNERFFDRLDRIFIADSIGFYPLRYSASLNSAGIRNHHHATYLRIWDRKIATAELFRHPF
jgi:hypothetical protein